MGRIIGRGLLGLLIAIACVYLGDWAVWRARLAAGGGMGKIMVSQIQVAELKGNKEQYYWNGTAQVDCSRSLFPQAGAGACWWLARHNVLFER